MRPVRACATCGGFKREERCDGRICECEAVAEQNIVASESRCRGIDIEPTKEEMMLAWKEFKETKLFAVLVAHAQSAVELISIEGTLWGFFYNGYLAGAKR